MDDKPLVCPTAPAEILNTIASLHELLNLRFMKLANRRKELPDQPPVYAIEHGLQTEDLSVLCDAVSRQTYRSSPPPQHWLPFIVYATEIGYNYEGEYWPTLEAKAPGWERNATRQYVKTQFLRFAKTYNGAKPSGAWARQFSIICWPITHAILPTDLQRQFAQLLYDYRGVLTSKLLEEPHQLGRVLAARTYSSSKRFQQFAQNTDLLGHVAAALLAGHGDVPTINPPTLKRITDDLSEEQQARHWLSDARSSANHIRLKGVTRAQDSQTTTIRKSAELQRPTAPVSFSLHPGSSGWRLCLRVPDFKPLFTRYPELQGQIEQLRCRIAGTNGRPRARGWLLDSGQQVVLNKWPGHDSIIFELESASVQTAELFASESRTPPYQPWLFRIGPDGTGHLVRSQLVRIGIPYIILGPDLKIPTVDWVNEQKVECEGAICLAVEVPDDIDSTITQTVHALGCSIQTSVEVSPVGFVPAAWDGDGVGEWIVGDNPMLKLKCAHEIISCTATLNNADSVHLSSEDFVDKAAILELRDLNQGWHDLRLSFKVPEATRSIPDLGIEIHMREAEPKHTSGTFRDPLRLRITIPGASLEDIWDDRASISADGPPGTQTSLNVALLESGTILNDHKFKITLPVTTTEWTEIFETQVRRRSDFQEVYDSATLLKFILGDDYLGYAELLLERELVPLRWGFQRGTDQTILRLYEAADTNSGTTKVTRYPFKTPDTEKAENAETSKYFNPSGGLFVARLDRHEAKAILPPTIHDLHDLRSARSAVQLRKYERTGTSITNLVQLAALWGNARYPGHILARDRRSAVATAINREIASIIGGKKWASIESSHSDGKTLSIENLDTALTKPGYWIDFRNRVQILASSLDQLEYPPIKKFSSMVDNLLQRKKYSFTAPSSNANLSRIKFTLLRLKFTKGELWLAELYFRLASAPESIMDWLNRPEESIFQEELIFNEILKEPIIYRAARMLAIIAHQEGKIWKWN